MVNVNYDDIVIERLLEIVDDWVGEWHAMKPDVALPKYLGMSGNEYVVWLTSPLEWARERVSKMSTSSMMKLTRVQHHDETMN